MMKNSKLSSRWFGIPLLLAVPLLVINCSDDDSEPTRPSAGGSSADGGGSPGGAAGDTTKGEHPLICAKQSEISQCDPITAAECDVSNGWTCEHAAALGGYKCFPNSVVKPGEYCDNGEFSCAVGTFCNTELAVCQHYCCDDSDCVEGVCDRGYFVDGEADIGLCWSEFGGRCFYGIGGAGPDCEGVGGAPDGLGGAGGAGGAAGG
jgi:hypothetical protein